MNPLPLNGARCYLSGPIEYQLDLNWRNKPKEILEKKFGINVFDPFEDPKQQWVPVLDQARKDKDYDKIVEISKSFVRKDLCLVDRSDFLIAYLPYKVPTTGTIHEIINANNAKKPTLLVTDKNDISFIPVWFFGFINRNSIFPNWESLYDYLDEVQNGKHLENNRWSYLYGIV